MVFSSWHALVTKQFATKPGHYRLLIAQCFVFEFTYNATIRYYSPTVFPLDPEQRCLNPVDILMRL